MTENALRLLAPCQGETVYLYCDAARRYLETEDFLQPGLVGRCRGTAMWDSAKPVLLLWETDTKPCTFRVAYGTEEEWQADAPHSFTTAETSAELWNLYKASAYRWQVEALFDDGTLQRAEGCFSTADLGPRVITAEGLANARDIGGYMTAFGTRTKQGRIYRSACYTRQELQDGTVELTQAGADTLIHGLGIRTEIDIRNRYIEQSPLSSPMQIIRHEILQYGGLLTAPENYIAALDTLADGSLYPVILHCWGGADRTGTLCLCIESILCYSDKVLINDFEYTSFSILGIRDKTETREPWDNVGMQELFEAFSAYEGDSIAARCLAYLRAKGLREETVAAIRRNMT